LGGELGTAVGYDFGRYPVKTEYLLVMDIRDPVSIDIGCRGDSVHLFTVMVNIHSDGIVPSDPG
jgi:hypothetical protein